MQDLFIKYLNNECSPEEVKQLLAFFNAGENEDTLRALIKENLETPDFDDDGSQWTSDTDRIFAGIKKELGSGKPKLVPMFRRAWFQVAAAIFVLVGVFAVYRFSENNKDKQETVKLDTTGQDIPPGTSKAVLTLADGANINLESAENGQLARQGNATVIKQAGGFVTYNVLSEKPTKVLINSITVPRGGHFQLILSDGSKVWINAASTLRFPAAFAGSERKVELSGEAFFQVAKDASMPFKVAIAGKGEVEVLGTEFNINAYPDEATMSTTLTEGRVQVRALSGDRQETLAAGEQALLDQKGRLITKKDIDTNQVIAWKNGAFSFDNADLSTVFRQLSRWYDVEIKFEGAVPERKFKGEMQRDLKLSQVLKLFEKHNVFCTLEGKTLIVKKEPQIDRQE